MNLVVPALIDSLTFPLDVPEIPKSIIFYQVINILFFNNYFSIKEIREQAYDNIFFFLIQK